ncbi:hypothetical protein L3Y34_018699 [Caenorhabditis briggsae]|uniref:C2H2-type domain-containing protein n=1 Tax=Caenorhabditis briggsae TaxID=6238 RepID=A0AAE9IVR2_CAEBR|nr:hypothetical protein L3Y34_018699 [Caenorhabditis briggsae]
MSVNSALTTHALRSPQNAIKALQHDHQVSGMPLTVQSVGKELCFWCVEAFRGCPIHENSKVFWNDTSVKSYTDESDGFRIVNEKELINLENSSKKIIDTSSGKFLLPANSSSLPVSSVFHFEKVKEIPAPHELKEVPETIPKKKKYNKKEVCKKPKQPKEVEDPDVPRKKRTYNKAPKNGIKAIPVEGAKGKKEKSQKLFVCEICEFACTVRRNLESHFVEFHGRPKYVSEVDVIQYDNRER